MNFINHSWLSFCFMILILLSDFNHCPVMTFIDILEQIFDCLDAGTDLHIDMTIVLCTEKLVVWDNPSIIQQDHSVSYFYLNIVAILPVTIYRVEILPLESFI